jgi:hypothetical protein
MIWMGWLRRWCRRRTPKRTADKREAAIRRFAGGSCNRLQLQRQFAAWRQASIKYLDRNEVPDIRYPDIGQGVSRSSWLSVTTTAAAAIDCPAGLPANHGRL